MSAPSGLVRLLRLPSVLTAPGDVLLGAASRGGDRKPEGSEVGALVATSSMTYLAGMALNDWADRELDARERPGRPIPAGEVRPSTALALSAALSAGALGVAARTADGRAAIVAGPLVAVVWTYDLAAKGTAAGPWAMALARSLDVLLGAGSGDPQALSAASVIGAHTLLISLASASEAGGAGPSLGVGAIAGVSAVTALAAWSILGKTGTAPARRVPAIGALGLYAWSLMKEGAALLRRADPASVQRFVGTGVFANMPLQAALLAGKGRRPAALALLASWPVARRLGRRVAVS
jgi:hypothetical protein